MVLRIHLHSLAYSGSSTKHGIGLHVTILFFICSDLFTVYGSDLLRESSLKDASMPIWHAV